MHRYARDEIAGLNETAFLLSEGETLVDVKSSKKFQHRHFPVMAYHRIPALTDLRLDLR